MPGTSILGTDDIPHEDLANERFGDDPGLLVIRPGGSCFTPWITVPEGCYALVSRFGKIENFVSGSCVWPTGFAENCVNRVKMDLFIICKIEFIQLVSQKCPLLTFNSWSPNRTSFLTHQLRGVRR